MYRGVPLSGGGVDGGQRAGEEEEEEGGKKKKKKVLTAISPRGGSTHRAPQVPRPIHTV